MKPTVWGLICGIAVGVTGGGIARAATTCVWVGNANKTNGKSAKFSDTTNWSCGVVPGSTYDIVFDPTQAGGGNGNGDCGFDTIFTVNSLTIANSYSGNIAGNKNGTTATVNNAFVMSATSATFTGGSGTLAVGSLSISGGSFSDGGGTIQVGGISGSTVSASFSAASGTFSATGTMLLAGTATSGQTVTSGGNSFATLTVSGGTYTLSDNLTTTGPLTLTSGTLAVGSNTVTAGSTVAVQSTGTLTLSTGSSLAVGSALTMDGTLNATGATIKASSSARYTFEVGSTATATPILNINGLAVQNTDANGMWINAVAGATTTFSKFDKLAFSGGTGNQLLNISASVLYLSSNGCTFDGSTTYAVKLAAVGTTSNPRALFGDATCATNDPTTGLCATSEKQDNDANNDGIPDSGNGAVVQFIRAAESDTHGSLVGFPTAAFNWNTFSYYSTYVAFHNASSGSDVIYVRDESGNPLYSWTDPNLIAGTTETIVGTPLWTTVGSTHYVYVAVNGSSANTGGVYRLIDTGTQSSSGTMTLDTSWPSATKTGYYACSCTVTSDAQLDANNVYWAATSSGGQQLFGITQTAGAAIKTGWPVTAPANVTTSAPTLVTSSGTTSLYLGATSTLATLNFTSLAWTQDAPAGIGTITGRVSYGTSTLAATNGTSRIYVGDASSNVWAVNPSSFTGTNFLWKYAAGGAVTDNYYDAATDTVQFGTATGTVVALTGAGSGTSGVVVNSSYPYTLPNSDAVSTAPLFYNGVLVVGSSKGNLYFLDRNTGSTTAPNGVKIIKEVNFGSTESVSTIGFDFNVTRFMVSTSSSANDGRLYYFDIVSDPTPSVQ